MCIQILKTEIIPKHRYSSYLESPLVFKAIEYPDCTFIKVHFTYKSHDGVCHILIESTIFQEPQEVIDNKIREIVTEWAEENFYKVCEYEPQDGKNDIIFH